jgi:hypothetical protein
MFEKKELYAFTISLTVSHAFTPNALKAQIPLIFHQQKILEQKEK